MNAHVIVKLYDLDFDSPSSANILLDKIKAALGDIGTVQTLYESRISDIFNVEWRVSSSA